MISRDTLNCFDGDDRAVSPVIGVALLIAITVVLAAVIGFVVLSSSQQTTDVPSAQLNIAGSANDTSLSLTHQGGDQINASNVQVVANGKRTSLTQANGLPASDILQTGTEIELSDSAFGTWDQGDKVTLVWNDPNSDRSSQLTSFTVPAN